MRQRTLRGMAHVAGVRIPEIGDAPLPPPASEYVARGEIIVSPQMHDELVARGVIEAPSPAGDGFRPFFDLVDRADAATASAITLGKVRA